MKSYLVYKPDKNNLTFSQTVEPTVNATDKAMNLRPFVICFAQDVQSLDAKVVIRSFNRDCGLFYFQFLLDFLGIGSDNSGIQMGHTE